MTRGVPLALGGGYGGGGCQSSLNCTSARISLNIQI